MLLLAPFVHAGAVWARRPPWSGQWCNPPTSGEKRADRKKNDFSIHANPLRVARADTHHVRDVQLARQVHGDPGRERMTQITLNTPRSTFWS